MDSTRWEQVAMLKAGGRHLRLRWGHGLLLVGGGRSGRRDFEIVATRSGLARRSLERRPLGVRLACCVGGGIRTQKQSTALHEKQKKFRQATTPWKRTTRIDNHFEGHTEIFTTVHISSC